MEEYIIAVDQGTTSTKTVLYSLDGEIKAVSNNPVRQLYPKEGWVEHDPHDLLDSIRKGIVSVMSRLDVKPSQILAMGLDNQGETIIPFDKITGEPLHNAIVWQDRRASSYCASLKDRVNEETVTDKTGLFIDPYFSAPKINWLIKNSGKTQRSLKNGSAVLATSDVWLIYMLTGRRTIMTDVTTASRTLLYNINTLQWDDYLLGLFEVPRQTMPDVAPSAFHFGYTDPMICAGLSVPVNASAVDQQASLFGHACFARGQAKITYGTGGFLLLNTGRERVRLNDRIATTIAAQHDAEISYALDGGVYCVASCINWLINEMKTVSSPEELGKIDFSGKDESKTFFVPSMAGISAPYWKPDINGAFFGLSLSTRGKDLVRAMLEGLAFRFLELVNIIRENGFRDISQISVDGGVSRNDYLLQYQADLMGIPVRRPEIQETTSLGTFYLTGLKSGLWSSIEELRTDSEGGKLFLPESDNAGKIKKFRIWQGAVKSVINWHESF